MDTSVENLLKTVSGLASSLLEKDKIIEALKNENDKKDLKIAELSFNMANWNPIFQNSLDRRELGERIGKILLTDWNAVKTHLGIVEYHKFPGWSHLLAIPEKDLLFSMLKLGMNGWEVEALVCVGLKHSLKPISWIDDRVREEVDGLGVWIPTLRDVKGYMTPRDNVIYGMEGMF